MNLKQFVMLLKPSSPVKPLEEDNKVLQAFVSKLSMQTANTVIKSKGGEYKMIHKSGTDVVGNSWSLELDDYINLVTVNMTGEKDRCFICIESEEVQETLDEPE